MDDTAKYPGFFKTSWECTEKTFMKSSWVHSAELPEDMKIALEPGALLEGYSQPSQNNHVKFAESWLNGEPVKPEVCFINRAHWKRLAAEEPAPAPVAEPVAPPPVLEETSPVAEPAPAPVNVAPEPVAEPAPELEPPPQPEPVFVAPAPVHESLPPVLEETSPVAKPVPESPAPPEPVFVAPEPVHEPAAPPPVFQPAPEPAPASTRELPPRRVRAHFLQKLADFFAGKN